MPLVLWVGAASAVAGGVVGFSAGDGAAATARAAKWGVMGMAIFYGFHAARGAGWIK